MDGIHFDRLARRLSATGTRRGMVLGLVSTLGLAAPRHRGAAKGKKKPITLNQFGCVDVGGKCRGKNSLCCSGTCQGKKPKKGEKDKSRCVAHGERGCLAGQMLSGCGGATIQCVTSIGLHGACQTTTGNAGYCSGDSTPQHCTKDADCRHLCGPEAACILCNGSPRCAGPIDEGCELPLL
jgi:hypothetical protein